MRIDIVGAGSVGLLLAGMLAGAGCRIRMITRSREQAELLRLNGLTVHTGDGSIRSAVSAVEMSEAQHESGPDGPPEWVLLAVKQKDVTEELTLRLQRLMDGGARLLCFQNGVGHVEKLGRKIAAERIFVAVTTEAANRISGNEVVHTGRGTTSIGGAGPESGTDPEAVAALKKLAALLDQAGIRTAIVKNMLGIVWDKLLINAVINPLTAVIRIRNGELLRSDVALELMDRLLSEGVRLAECLEIPVSDQLRERLRTVCEATSANHSSMLQDLLRGDRTEIEWITGSMLRLAERQGLEMPSHRMMYHLVKVMESTNDGGGNHDRT